MPDVEFLMIANYAEAVNGLLYMSGAGWTDHWRGDLGESSPPSAIGIAMSVLIPWGETNRNHHFVVTIEGEDGGEPLARVEGDVQVGRPPGLASGADQRSVLALNALLAFPKAGGYRVLGQVGESMKSIAFRVHSQRMPMAMPPR